LTSRRLIVADSGQTWLDELFAEAYEQAAPSDRAAADSLRRWLEYKRRSISAAPQNWLALYRGDVPVGLAQGAGVVRVFHTHFFYLSPAFQRDEMVFSALEKLDELALRRRCNTISFEGARTTPVVKTLGVNRLVEAGFTWHERIHLRRCMQGNLRGPFHCEGFEVGPLRLLPEDVARLMAVETEAFQHAECDHPGELPSDFSDGYRTTLIPKAALSALARDDSGVIRGALYAEEQGCTAWIHTLFVEPAWRHQKIATALLDHCLCIHQEAGYTATELMVLAANFPAVHLYETAGFEEVKREDLFIRKMTRHDVAG
ncbi:MAG: GNAT family N-acetyltransferase, partial [Armatimonadota bacterium]|nr:GNAT family N-acetyltransferase [Armatimonadota bacterium]